MRCNNWMVLRGLIIKRSGIYPGTDAADITIRKLVGILRHGRVATGMGNTSYQLAGLHHGLQAGIGGEINIASGITCFVTARITAAGTDDRLNIGAVFYVCDHTAFIRIELCGFIIITTGHCGNKYAGTYGQDSLH